MAKIVQTSGNFTIHAGQELLGSSVSEYTVSSASGELGSVIHGLRIELRFRGDVDVSISMGAADALQLSEEIRAAVHRREDVRR